ncbi:hypothetical protein Tco_0103253 [Tanacetum coccineum]
MAVTVAVVAAKLKGFENGGSVLAFIMTLQRTNSEPKACHDSKIEALVQSLINEDKGCQDVLLNLAFQFEDSCAESSKKDRKLHLSMYGKASQLQKQMGAKSAWFQEKYSGRTHRGIGCSSSQTNCPLTEKELHQLRMDEEALKEMLEEEAMNKKAQKEKIRQEQAENNALFQEFGVVRYDSEYESSD